MLAILAESALRSLVLGSVVWVGLNLLRVRNPHLQMTSWVMVLVASLSMPLLMHWTTVTVTLDPLPAPTPENLWSAQSPLPEPLGSSLPSDLGVPVAVRGEIYQAVNWWAVATAIYAVVAGMLLLRLAVGICLTWRLARAAKPISEPWVASSNVRVSGAIGGPVTFGSTILLPPQYKDWDLSKRQAVLAHEGAHVSNRDFYVLLLASLNRAVFWFSPLAWWQLIRLAELAEIISDARALEVVEDRLSYAEILLDFVQNVQRAPAGLEMARACTVRARVERILAETTAPAQAGWRKLIWTALAIVPVIMVSAGSITYSTPPATTLAIDGAADTTTAARKPERIDFYSLDPTSILAIFREGDDLFGQLTGQRKLHLTVAQDGTYSYPAVAGEITFAIGNERQPSELVLRQNGSDLRAARIAQIPGQGIEVDAKLLDSYAGWYELNPSHVLTVTRNGDRMQVKETGRAPFEVTADGANAFSSKRGDVVIFLRDGQANVSQVLRQDPMRGARVAPRVDGSRAKMVEEEFARRIAEAPDRFREQAPMPGSKEAVLRGIEDLQRGAPNYDRMSAPLAAAIRRQASELQSMLKALGAVESIFFRGVGPGGYDIYGVKFADGFAEFRLLLGADGKTDDVIFRPDGNEQAGGVVACSDEQALRFLGDSAPIRILLYNSSGRDIQLYKLDAQGKRVAHGTIGENMSSSMLTTVGIPWVVADSSGQCLEIVLPGQRTRYLNVEASHAGSLPEQSVSRRTTPLVGSEEMLRQYIETVRRGEPNYDRMASQVAAYTREQLLLNQAILTRLGPLRALSFRGATDNGIDVYMAHFANGSAEWRIGLVKDGTIGRIALGPQY
jgi:beta-lactamase regulating signal transducer with metallopeptidase domain